MFFVPIPAQELFSDSPQLAGSQGNPSQQIVEVTGMYLNPDSLIPR